MPTGSTNHNQCVNYCALPVVYSTAVYRNVCTVCGEWIQISEDIKHSTTHTSTENVNLHWTVISLLVFVVYYYSIPKFVTNTIH